jgi:hypothetical protein
METRTSDVVGKYPLPAKPLKLHKPLWSREHGTVAVAVDLGETRSIVPGFFRTRNGHYKALDFSQRTGALGKLGEDNDHWVKIRNLPIRWNLAQNSYGDVFLDVKTQVWNRSEQRFTVNESVRITNNGELLGR